MSEARHDLDVALGARVRWARTFGGMTQVELAERVGLTNAVLSRIELGQRSLLAIEVAPMCAGLGLTVPELLGVEAISLTRSAA